LRLAHALTQAELADRAGVSRTSVMKLEAGTRPAWPSTLRKIARALDVSPMALNVGHEA